MTATYFKCNVEALGAYRSYINEFCQKISAAFGRLKKKCENAQWNDDVYVAEMNRINEVRKIIADDLSKLSECSDKLNALIQASYTYLQNANKFNIN